jgi:hypothetical protein
MPFYVKKTIESDLGKKKSQQRHCGTKIWSLKLSFEPELDLPRVLKNLTVETLCGSTKRKPCARLSRVRFLRPKEFEDSTFALGIMLSLSPDRKRFSVQLYNA